MDKFLALLAPTNHGLIWLNFIILAVGTVILVKGSDWFVDSAILFARKFKVSEVVIGLTLVSIGTSLPELAANINAVIKGSGAIAIGNVAGSNITNITLVGGTAALLMAGGIKFQKKLLSRDMLILLFATILLLVFSYMFPFDGNFKILRFEAIIMASIIVLYLLYLFKFNKKDIESEAEEESANSFINKIWIALLFFFISGGFIFIGSELMVRNVIVIAKRLNISEGIISATIVALGTSVPELAVSIASVVKKRGNLGLGNIVGSNIFNILGVLGITGIIRNIDISLKSAPDTRMLYWTLPLTMITAILLFIFMLHKQKLGKVKGIILLLIYVGYLVVNYTGIPFLGF